MKKTIKFLFLLGLLCMISIGLSAQKTVPAMVYEQFAGKWVLERYEDYADKVVSTEITISAASDETDKDYNMILHGTCTDLMYPGLGLTWNWNMEYTYDPVTKKGTIGFVMGELNATMSTYYFYMYQMNGASLSTETASASWILDESGNLPNEITFDPEMTIYMVDPAFGWFSCMSEMKLKKEKNDFYVDGIYYKINSSTDLKCDVVGYDGISNEISIPSTIVNPNNGKTYSVTSIGNGAFSECFGLTSVTIPNSVTSIGNRAFFVCYGLTSVTIPNSVTSIGGHAFEGCSGLTSVTIPNSVTSIEDSTFYNCSGLTSVAIPNSVTSIGRAAFDGCTGLMSIEIPNSVTSIGRAAFGGCRGLTSVTIPNSVTSIEDYTFNFCTGLMSIEIPNSVTSIRGHAFYGCLGLNSVTIPNSVTSIGERAFEGCSGLTAVNITDIDKWAEIEFSDGTLEFGTLTANPLYYAKKLYLNGKLVTDAKLTSVTRIGSFTFYNCSSLTSVTILNSVTSIGTGAFSGCSSLASVTIGNSVTSIEDGAFYECNALEDVFVSWSKPLSVPTNVFDKNPSGKILIALHVPIGKTKIYQSADVWRDFYDMQEWDPSTGIEEIKSQSTVNGQQSTDLYNLQGQRVKSLGLRAESGGARSIVIKNGKKYLMK